jgi:hypothetical protein
MTHSEFSHLPTYIHTYIHTHTHIHKTLCAVAVRRLTPLEYRAPGVNAFPIEPL